MLWGKENQFFQESFELENELEEAILEVSAVLFGENRIYLDTKKKIGPKGKTQKIIKAVFFGRNDNASRNQDMED